MTIYKKFIREKTYKNPWQKHQEKERRTKK